VEVERRRQDLRELIQAIFWNYLRVRMRTRIPDIDQDIGRGVPERVGHYRVGKYIGKGTFGRVYKLHELDGTESNFVLKTLAKSGITDICSMRSIQAQIAAMRRLSEKWPHPNIIRLHEILQSETHVLFRVEDGGPYDLFRYLRSREKRELPLRVKVAESIIAQLTSAVSHFHTKATMVHLDLKPENIILSETNGDAVIKVTDFDTVQINPAVPFSGLFGTFPFTAPEMLEGEYDPYAADSWSTGVVLLEMLCNTEVVELSLNVKIDKNAQEKPDLTPLMSTVRSYFSEAEAVRSLLQQWMRPGLREMMVDSLFQILESMVTVASQRSCAERVARSACAFLNERMPLPEAAAAT
jgi:serine/threonine protein kinase